MDIDGQRTSSGRSSYALKIAWLMVLSVCFMAYFAGLGGPFIVDDFAALEPLAKIGGQLDWAAFKAYVFGGFSGPTGRPITMASFLVDANNWPADPAQFKRTNVIIHLINGTLVALVMRRILTVLGYSEEKASWAALIAAGIWVLHPFLVSTTLYVVQRLAQLSTLFVLLGLLGHLYGRSLLTINRRKAYLVMSASIVVFTVLATFSKENGALLPMLIGCLEVTVFAARHASHRGRLDFRWMFAFIWMPAIAIGVYLMSNVFSGDFFAIAEARSFSLYERALTEFRVVADYLQNWFVPKLYTTGVFQDHVKASDSLFQPVTTVLSLILHVAAIGFAIAWRRKAPLLALAILFFYAGHTLESTTLNLELYFEHRNYLPAIFLFLPVVVFLQDRMSRYTFFASAALALLVLASFTRYSATIWGDYPSMVAASVDKAPGSTRAQAEFARQYFNAGDYNSALQSIDLAISDATHNRPHLEITRLMMLCNLALLDKAEMDRVTSRMAAERYDSRLISIYDEFAHSVIGEHCPDIALDQLRNLFVSMLRNPANSDKRSIAYSQLYYFIGLVDVYDGDGTNARNAFVKSLNSQPDASMAVAMYSLMATKGNFSEALQLSEHALQHTDIDEPTVRAFQALVRRDIERQQVSDTVDPD